LLNTPDRRTRLGKRDAALLAVLVGAGLRLGEACSLTIESVEITDRVRITVRTAKSRGLKFRTVTLPAPCARLLCGWLSYGQPRWWVFPGNHNEPLTPRHAGRIVRFYLRKIDRGDLHPHNLRHTYATMLVRQSHDIWLVQKQLGHSDPRITSAFYAHADNSDADRAADALEGTLK
jgi:integrase/recombinase XerC